MHFNPTKKKKIKNQRRSVLNWVCGSIKGAQSAVWYGAPGGGASWPRPLRVRRINRVYLSTYFTQTSSVAWHWLAGVFCLSPSQSRPTIEGLRSERSQPPPTPPPSRHTGCSLWRRKKSQNSRFQPRYRQLFPLPLLPRGGRTLAFDMTVCLSDGCLNGDARPKAVTFHFFLTM